MKKVLSSILLTLLPLLASAEAVEINGIWYNIITKGNAAEVIKNPSFDQYEGCYSGSIRIPEKVTYNDIEYPVTKIGNKAFESSYNLTSIIIPNSVSSIGDGAFYKCCGLTLFTIPNSVTSLGNSCFMGCTGLTSITIPNSVTSLGQNVFQNCSSLTSVIISNNVTSIEWYAFRDCSNLTSISIPEGVTFIGTCVFTGCTKLMSVNLPSTLNTIKDCAFYGCTSLKSIVIPNSVVTIGGNAFEGCTGLTSVTIPHNVASIGAETFAKCDNITDVYCKSERVRNTEWSGDGLYTSPNAFDDSYPEYITLHVPSASIEAYRAVEPWSKFKDIVALTDDDTPVLPKCATPEICYASGKIDFICETEGVKFVSTVTTEDVNNYYDASINLSQIYTITVYATKEGYEASDVATREIVIENGKTTLFGDLNKDGKVNVADHVKLSDIILNK